MYTHTQRRPLVLLGTLLALLTLLAAPALAAATVIPSLPYTISSPGAYILESNLTGAEGIIIQASHVTLDLNGFALIGEPGNHSHGVNVRDKVWDIEIRNGSVTAWGLHGIFAGEAQNSQYYFLRLYANAGDGLHAGDASVIENIVGEHNLDDGLEGGDSLVVRESEFAGNGMYGVKVGAGANVTELTVDKNLAGGIFAKDGSRIYGNALRANGGGFKPDAEPTSASFAGVTIKGRGSRVIENTLAENTLGLLLLDGGNSVAGNHVVGGLDNYQFAPGNQLELLIGELPEELEWPCVARPSGTLMGIPGRSGIRILSSDVTLDLGGHCLAGVPGSLHGIFVEARVDNVLVRDGILRDWDACGIEAMLATNSRLVGLRLLDNAASGARIGPDGAILDTVAAHNLDDGLVTMLGGEVRACTVTDNPGDGVKTGPRSLVIDTKATGNGKNGISVEAGSHVMDCIATNSRTGINAGPGSQISGCSVSNNDFAGIRVGARSQVTDNSAHMQTHGTGILVTAGPGTRVESNTLGDNGVGLRVLGGRNVVYCNLFASNATHYSIHPMTAYGQFIDISAGGQVNNDQPWCNYLMGP